MLNHREKRICLAGLFVLLAALYTWPIFARPHNWGIQDWDHDLFWHAFPRDAIVEHQQFPLWCPYLNGGVPYLARAESSICSPLFLPVLFFGEHAGIRFSIFLHTVIGLTGAFFLARHFELDFWASLFTAAVYNLSSFLALTLTCGMTLFLPSVYLPSIFLFFAKGARNTKWLMACALLLAMVIGEGGAYLFVIISFFLAVYVLFHLERKRLYLARNLVLVGVLTFGIGAVKIVPFYDLVHGHKRQIEDLSGFSIKSLGYSLLHPDQRVTSPIWQNVPEPGAYGPDEHGMYIGVVAFVFALIGMAGQVRKNPRMFLMFLFFLWIIMGYHTPVLEFGGQSVSTSLWGLLRSLPVFDSMRVAQRFRFVWLLLLALYSGFGAMWLRQAVAARTRNTPRKVLDAALTLVIVLAVVRLTMINASVFSQAFVIRPLNLYPDKTFKQIGSFYPYDDNGFVKKTHALSAYSSYYYAYLSNKGTVWSGLSHVSLPKKAVPFHEPGYRGEVFLANDIGKIRRVEITPNRVTVELDMESSDILVVNQNYYEGWKAKGLSGKNYTVKDRNGLIAAQIDRGPDSITFYYRPAAFIIGSAVTVITLFFCACYLFLPRLTRVC